MSATIKTTNPGKQIFYICLLFFAGLQLYGIYFSDLRMQSDASDDFIRYATAASVFPPQPVFFRYAYVLNKFLLKPAFLLHLSIPVIAKIYCFNDALFYMLVALLIIKLTRQYVYAAIVLATPVLIHGCNFYFIFNELFLSGSVMVLYLAVYRHMAESRAKMLLLAGCLFFIVFSHPVMLLVLMVFMVGMYAGRGQVLRDKRLLALLFVVVVTRMLLLSRYDYTRIHQDSNPVSLVDYLNTFLDYCRVYWFILLLAAGGIYVRVKSGKRVSAYAGLLILPGLLYLCVAHKIRAHELDFSKYLYPVNLFVLTFAVVDLSESAVANRRWLPAGVLGVLSVGMFCLLFNFHNRFMGRTVLLRSLIAACDAQHNGNSKWFIKSDSVIALDPMITGINSESILFSALDGRDTTIQIIRATNDERRMVEKLDKDRFFLNGDVSFPISDLNPFYFKLKEGTYKELKTMPKNNAGVFAR